MTEESRNVRRGSEPVSSLSGSSVDAPPAVLIPDPLDEIEHVRDTLRRGGFQTLAARLDGALRELSGGAR